MFAWGAATRIYLAAGATDLRKGCDGLYALVRERLELDPLKRARVRVRQPGAYAAADSVLGWFGVVAGDEA